MVNVLVVFNILASFNPCRTLGDTQAFSYCHFIGDSHVYRLVPGPNSTHTHLILFEHICLWVMILFHNLSCFLRARDSWVVMAIKQYKPTKCTLTKLIFYKLYQLPRPQYITHTSTYLLTYLLTHSMVQSPSWEARWFAASQGIPRVSRNPKVHYRTHKRPPPVPILGQPNPVHIHTSHLLEIHPNIIHPFMPMSSQWSPSLRFLPTRLLILLHVPRTVP